MSYFVDPQAAPPVAMCPICGREIYAPGLDICRRCQEEMEYQDAE